VGVRGRVGLGVELGAQVRGGVQLGPVLSEGGEALL